MTIAYIFPGQGSQAVGMGQALSAAFPVAKETFQEVDDALSYNLSKLMFEGPEEDLTLTENAQPAIMACSIAALRVLEKEVGVDVARDVSLVAGHSLGEYSALTAAKALPLHETAKLLQIRGRAMQESVPQGEGAMAAVLGLPFARVEALLKIAEEAGEVCEIANYNSDSQIVISGSVKGVELVGAEAKNLRARKVVPLPVSAPFHCSLMKPAATVMEKALAIANFSDPVVPVVTNVNATHEREADKLRVLLVEQVTGTVRWKESVDYMNSKHIDQYIEIGHGKVLSTMIKRMVEGATISNVGEPADFDAFAKAS
ncbi:MAG: ACP S-malonyltransferase [Rickettsiales bacterium]|nr:ACP S-malonyltransferase [Rickettsiales bacterium]